MTSHYMKKKTIQKGRQNKHSSISFFVEKKNWILFIGLAVSLNWKVLFCILGILQDDATIL